MVPRRAIGALVLLTGLPERWAQATDATRTRAGVQKYLDRIGVLHFDAEELITPRWPDLVQRLYNTDVLIPPMELLPNWGLNLRLVGDLMRTETGPVMIRHAWRPSEYNSAVNGAPRSLHIEGGAIDYVFRSRRQRRLAELAIRPLWESGIWSMGVGVGGKVLHVDLLRSRQARWAYGRGNSLENFPL